MVFTEEILRKKVEETEWILAEMLACTPLEDIRKYGELIAFPGNPTYELYKFKGKPILEVTFVFDTTNPRWEWRKFAHT